MALRNTRRTTVTLFVAGVCASLVIGMYLVGRRVIVPVFEATRNRQAPYDRPVERYASSEAVLAAAGTSVAAVDRIRPRIDPRGDLVLLASRAEPVYSGSLYLQLAYFLAPRTVALLNCGDQAGLLVPMGNQKMLGGVVYQKMEPPAWVGHGRDAVDMFASGRTDAQRMVFIPFAKPVAEVRDWTQFCR